MASVHRNEHHGRQTWFVAWKVKADGTWRQKRKYFGTTRDAEKRARHYARLLDAERVLGRDAPPSTQHKVQLLDWATAWLDQCDQSPAWIRVLETWIVQFVSFCHDREITDLNGVTNETLLAWLKYLRDDQGQTARTVRGKLYYVRAALLYAEEREWIDRAPRMPKSLPSVPRTRKRFLSINELTTVEHACGTYRQGYLLPVFALGAYAGMRRAEICRARREDVDRQHFNALIIRGRKTGDVDRMVPLSDDLLRCRWASPT